MRPLWKGALALALVLALAGALGAASFGLRSDGYYAPPKGAADVMDYSIAYHRWLAGDTIATSTWTYASGITGGAESINQVPITLPNGETAPAFTVVTMWLSGGTAGQTYEILNKITTAGGRTRYQVFKITVK